MPSSFSPSTALVPFAIGLEALVITAILLVWNASARRAYVGPETVIFALTWQVDWRRGRDCGVRLRGAVRRDRSEQRHFHRAPNSWGVRHRLVSAVSPAVAHF